MKIGQREKGETHRGGICSEIFVHSGLFTPQVTAPQLLSC